jgi:hypothetical protein
MNNGIVGSSQQARPVRHPSSIAPERAGAEIEDGAIAGDWCRACALARPTENAATDNATIRNIRAATRCIAFHDVVAALGVSTEVVVITAPFVRQTPMIGARSRGSFTPRRHDALARAESHREDALDPDPALLISTG